MPIRNIQLKNGSKYPVGETWREPITPGRAMDFDIEYDAEATGFATGVFGYYMTASGAGSIQTVETMKMWPIQSGGSNIGTLTQDELAACSVRMSKNGATVDAGDAVLMSTNELGMYYAALIAEQMSTAMGTALEIDSGQAYSGLPGSWALSSEGGVGVALASFSEAVTESVYSEITLGGGAVTLRLTLTVPAAGAYWSSTVPEATLASMALEAVISICTWHIDRRFAPPYAVGFDNRFFFEQLIGNGVFDLTKSPACLAKIVEAGKYGAQIVINGQLSVSYDRSGISWTFADGSTVTATIGTSTKRLTYTAAS